MKIFKNVRVKGKIYSLNVVDYQKVCAMLISDDDYILPEGKGREQYPGNEVKFVVKVNTPAALIVNTCLINGSSISFIADLTAYDEGDVGYMTGVFTADEFLGLKMCNSTGDAIADIDAGVDDVFDRQSES